MRRDRRWESVHCEITRSGKFLYKVCLTVLDPVTDTALSTVCHMDMDMYQHQFNVFMDEMCYRLDDALKKSEEFSDPQTFRP